MGGSSEYMSSGCESGWTMYLQDHSINPSSSSSLRDPPVVDEEYNISNNQRRSTRSKHKHRHDDKEEEDNLSMLSDASSPNLHHLQGYYFTPKTEESNSTPPHHHHKNYNTTYDSHFLDDTATSHSHLMDFYPNNGYIPTNNTTPPPVETFLQYPSHGFFQQTDFEASSALQHHLGFGIMQPPRSIIPTNSHSPVVRLKKGYRG